MPFMFKERPEKAATVNLGDVTVETTPVTAGVQKQFRGNRSTANLVLPAGAYSVFFRNVDASGGSINVNGEPISFNGSFSKAAQVDQVNDTQDFVGEVIISNPDGKSFWLDVSYPSSSNFNPETL